MWTSALAERWQHLLGNIPDLQLRADLLRAEFLQRDPDLLIDGLQDIFLAHVHDAQTVRHVIVSIVCALAPAVSDPARARLQSAVARRNDARLLATCLGMALDRPEISPDDPDRLADCAMASGADRTRPLTLGERKSLARTTDRKLLDRAARDPHPDVIAILLANPALTEERVVRIAARRPTSRAAQRTIAGHARWCARPRIQQALTLSPYTPAFVAAPLTLLLPREALADVVANPASPRAVRVAAELLFALRQPPGAKSDHV